MEKNDIFNTNLLQLPLKAQVADEEVVQNIAPVAEPTAPAMREGLVLDVLAQDGGVLRRLSNVTPKKCEKLASGFLHRGEITLLCGDGGVGKGQFVAQIAKSLTTGEPTEFFPQAPEGTGNIVILAGEDPIDTVLCPRMDAAGADLNKVAVIAPDTYYEEMHKMPQLGDPDLMNWIAAGDPLLLVIDPFQAFLPDSVNLNNRQQIRNLLQLLRMQAQQHGFAILLVTHTNKNPGACFFSPPHPALRSLQIPSSSSCVRCDSISLFYTFIVMINLTIANPFLYLNSKKNLFFKNCNTFSSVP